MLDLKAACARVAEAATHVRIVQGAIAPYAARLAAEGLTNPEPAPMMATPPEREAACAKVLTLDAINFGSGWFPTLRKRPGLSGYRTIAAGLGERFAARGPWSAAELSRIDPAEVAAVLGQDPAHELIGLFAASLRDLGRRIVSDYGSRFATLVDAAGGSAVALASTLGGWPCFADTSAYRGLRLPFLKRAQIAAADLQRAGAARFSDLHRLTIFADNLVPHVLALDGVLRLSEPLRARIAAEDLLEHGSEPEVELRACALHAAELLLREPPLARLTAAALDGLLWERGSGPRYKAVPRPRCRCTAY
jgi:hypothetical protein